MALAFWGNPTRNKNTQAEIDAYMKANPNVKITGQPGEFNSYWDKLATQTAGGTAPDIIQMDMAYIAEYGTRGALLDLAKYGVDTSKFVEGTVDSGKINGTLVGANAGINSAVIFANPKVFEKAKMDLPDDKTWTWDEMIEVGAEVASKAGVPFGAGSLFGSDALFGTFVRQHGKELFADKGLGFRRRRRPGLVRPDGQVPEGRGHRDARSRSARRHGQVAGPERDRGRDRRHAATTTPTSWRRSTPRPGHQLKMLRVPSLTGKATDRKTWYKASMLWSASSKTKNPEAAAAWINWWVNSTDAANIDLAERGIPANTEILAAVKPKLSPAQQTVAKFITDIKPELGRDPDRPTPRRRQVGRRLAPSRDRCPLREGDHGRRRAEVRGRDEVEPAGLMP